IVDFPKQTVTDHHSRTARLVMIDPDETPVTVFRVKVRPVARQNVSVQVDLQSKWQVISGEKRRMMLSKTFHSSPISRHSRYSAFTGCAFSTFLPHFLQVRRASSFQNSSIALLKWSTMSLQSKWMSSTSVPQFSQ